MQASPFSSASPPAAKKMIEYIDMSISLNIFVSPSPPAVHHIDDRMIDYICMNILQTRPKPAYGRQGLDWIVGPGYSFVVLSQPDFGSKRGN